MTATPDHPRGPAPESPWLFPWRERGSRLAALAGPAVLAALAAVFLLGSVRVKIASPRFEMERTGSVLYLAAEGDGAAWAAHAREAGPALSRYEPATWQGYRALERELAAATAAPLPPPREPKLHPLPAPPTLREPPLSAIGKPVLPARMPPVGPPEPSPAWRTVPTLRPLGPLGKASMPAALPPLAGPVNPEMAGTEWRYVLRLAPDGRVTDCLALSARAEDAGRIEAWLKSLGFDPRLAAGGGWFAVEVRFINQTDDGTDNR
jgi:hypothetical protein